MRDVSENRPEVKVIFVDTINSLMSAKEMKERRKTGFDERTICRIKISLIAGISLELYTLQRNHETWISVNV